MDFEKETTHGEWKPRKGSLYWYPLTPVLEIVVYPLLFGQARLVKGLRTEDSWLIGYDYPDVYSAMKAAEEWNGEGDPPGGWIKKLDAESEGVLAIWNREELDD